jgi:alginate O-acetyltransferase complex protein AlgJ
MTNHFKTGLFLLTAALTILIIPVNNLVHSGWQETRQDWFRADRAEGWLNLLLYRVLNQSTIPNKVITGKNGFLFLGNQYGNLVYKTQNIFPYASVDVPAWGERVKALQNWYTDQGIPVVAAMVPNKHSIYAEHLPDWLTSPRPNLSDNLMEEAKKQGVVFLDLRNPLSAAKAGRSDLLYWKTDSHWNLTGATVGFSAIMALIRQHTDWSLVEPEEQIINVPAPAMDLSGMMKLNPLLPVDYEQGQLFKTSDDVIFCTGTIDAESLHTEPCEDTTAVFMSVNQSGRYVINEQALNPQKVLLLADSFAMQNARLYHRTFHTVWALHYNELKGAELVRFVQQYQPDLVIYQVVERAVFQTRHFKDLPPAIGAQPGK